MHLGSTFLPFLLLLLVFQSPQDALRQHYEAAEAQRLAGNLAAAEAEYAAILAEGYGRLGKIYSAQGAYKKAIPALEANVFYRPDSEQALIELAIAYFGAEQYEKHPAAIADDCFLHRDKHGAPTAVRFRKLKREPRRDPVHFGLRLG